MLSLQIMQARIVSFVNVCVLVLSTLMGGGVRGDEPIIVVSLPIIQDIKQADIDICKICDHPIGVIVIGPGCNGNGKEWIRSSAWQKFAHDHNVDLIGLSFVSDVSLLDKGRGYYYVSQGSGQLLLAGIKQAYGRDMPLLLYGFSGGAHFVARLAEWKPDSVIAWCAYSAGWWDKPVKNKSAPPGLIVCGEEDQRLGASLAYFKQGRALGKPWLWMCAPQTGHSIYPPAEDFVRDYFASILDGKKSVASGEWVDIDLKTQASPETVAQQPSLTGWLPSADLLPEWQKMHQP